MRKFLQQIQTQHLLKTKLTQHRLHKQITPLSISRNNQTLELIHNALQQLLSGAKSIWPVQSAQMRHRFSTRHQNNVKNAPIIHLGYLLFYNALKILNSVLKGKFSIKIAKNVKPNLLVYQIKYIILLQGNVILLDLLVKLVCALQNPLFGTLRIFYARNAQFSFLIGMLQ